ncbi:hypothetical protein CBR_g4369 [Chara braunii]|uniref:Uncharacterized protein n=1 Tax=Chara braunii TaxID=69332 RepID=A0A388KHI5_CHABU|nr:hypothetical protein CBR_g4369 [Chara braunii]|eukprot:GBG69534.1 hypothetical protein CBR_g4369 [Chara braunii]
MSRWEGRDAYESKQRRLRELETGAVRPGGGPQMESGGPAADEGEAADVEGMLHREETAEERDAHLDCEEARLQSMPRWEGREAYESEQRRLRELETAAVRPGGGSPMESGGPTVGVATLASDHAVEGEHAPDNGGGTDGRPIGDDGDQNTGDDRSDVGDEGEAADIGGFIDRVIVGICAGDMEGGTPGAHGTSQVGDVAMEEAGLCTDRQGSDTGAGYSPVIEGVVGVDEEAQLSPTRDAAGDMSLALIVRPPSAFYADEGDRGRRLDERLGESTLRALDPEQLEREGMEDPYDHTGRRSDPRRPPDGFASPPRWVAQSPRWSRSSRRDVRGDEASDRQPTTIFWGGERDRDAPTTSTAGSRIR